MKIFSIFNHAAEKEFAVQLVEKLTKEVPPALMGKQTKLLSVNKITRLLERIYQQAAAYQSENRLGVVKRAVLANHFKWALKNRAYPDDFVDIATEGFVVAIAKKKTGEDVKS